ncbi:MAG: PadR family transcriptional regulator [Actinobacteria bacterium]|nr:MAG: PadR family transcriptional regulator [Actinomycetota bacterium]
MPRRRPPEHVDPAPPTPAMFHMLLALAAGEMHGYAIMREVAILSDGQMSIGPGTLYGSIKKMLAGGLIEESHRRPDPELDDERRRYYRVTEAGRRVVVAEAERLSRLVREARARRLLGPAAGIQRAT